MELDLLLPLLPALSYLNPCVGLDSLPICCSSVIQQTSLSVLTRASCQLMCVPQSHPPSSPVDLVTAGCIPIHLDDLHFRALFSLVKEHRSEFSLGNVSVSFGLARLGWSGMFRVAVLCFEELPAFDHLETQFNLLAFGLFPSLFLINSATVRPF